jgi:hypothetical protein
MQGERGQVPFHHAGVTILVEMAIQGEIHTFQVQIRELAEELQELRQLHPTREGQPPQVYELSR